LAQGKPVALPAKVVQIGGKAQTELKNNWFPIGRLGPIDRSNLCHASVALQRPS